MQADWEEWIFFATESQGDSESITGDQVSLPSASANNFEVEAENVSCNCFHTLADRMVALLRNANARRCPSDDEGSGGVGDRSEAKKHGGPGFGVFASVSVAEDAFAPFPATIYSAEGLENQLCSPASLSLFLVFKQACWYSVLCFVY